MRQTSSALVLALAVMSAMAGCATHQAARPAMVEP